MKKHSDDYFGIGGKGDEQDYVKLVKIDDMHEAEKFKKLLQGHNVDYYSRHPEIQKDKFSGEPPPTEMYVKVRDYKKALSILQGFHGKSLSEFGTGAKSSQAQSSKTIIAIAAIIVLLMGCGISLVFLLSSGS